jgi:gliding motility-associated-like protein
MINDINSFTPLVSPDVTTTYRVRYADSYGCVAFDSLTIKVVSEVTLQGPGDTTICRSDKITLNINSDALQYNWTPAATLNNAAVQDPIASPLAPTTTYHLVAKIGKCFKEDDITVRTVPYPIATAGSDTIICFGTSVQLQAGGGSSYSWTPKAYLNNSSIANPISQTPPSDIAYVVTVRDTLGCPKPVNDTVLIKVVRIIADAGPADTNIVLGQPLQLAATGGAIYSWTPATWLNNPTIFNPLALPEDNIDYIVKVSNAQGCAAFDTIRVNVFKIDPDLLVPTAFSPDGDGLNDIFQPILIGMRSLDAFMVYNRWGQLVYSTTQTETGWNGTFKGAPQGTGTFVWYAEGTNYLGKKIKKKGTVILIR